METLLENYEQESYYRRSRWRSGNTEEQKNEQPRDTRPRVNYVSANNNYYNNRYQGKRPYFNQKQNYDRREERNHDNRQQWNDHNEYRRSKSGDRNRDIPSGNPPSDHQGTNQAQVNYIMAEESDSRRQDAVSYTHLDVYKRQK